MMKLWQSAIGRAFLTAALAAVFISSGLLWAVEHPRDTGSDWSGVATIVRAAGTGVGECQFFSSAPPALTVSAAYPCRLDASRGQYVFIDNTTLAATQSGTWTVNTTLPFDTSASSQAGAAGTGVGVFGWDSTGSVERRVNVDGSGRTIAVGAGTAGSPGGGVLSVQGVSSGQALPISGNVGITGTLPAFASTPAFTISGTLPAFASTPAFTISGTLPAFAAQPTVYAQPMVGTLIPANGTAPKSALGCTNIIPTLASPTLPTVLVDINFISPTQLPSGASLEIFDETTATCSSGGTKIQLSTGQIGAGFRLGSPIVLSSGLSYQINTPGSFTFGTGYGLRFRTIP